MRLGLLLLSAALLVSGCVLALPGGWGGAAGLIGGLVALALAACTSSGGGGGKDEPNIGFVITGAANNDYAGVSVSYAGDVDDDGTGDIVIGATGAGSRGEAYIVFGRDAEDPVDIGGLASSDGVTLVGTTVSAGMYQSFSNGSVGDAVSWAGDLNNDGVDDVAVGDTGFSQYYYGTPYDTGATFVIFGDSGLASQINLANIATSPGSAGFAVLSYDTSGFGNTGHTLAGIGDISGDGIDDLLVGSPGFVGSDEESAGTAILGKGSFSANRDLIGLPATYGFQITTYGDCYCDYQTGRSVALAGDTNNDGKPDVVVGAPGFPFAYSQYGAAHVVFGFRTTLANTLYDPDNYSGFRIDGVNGVGIGQHVASAGDLNDDGKADVLVGAPYLSGNNGGAYVIFGGRANDADVDVSSMGSTVGFKITGGPTDSYAGSAGMGVGDVNGDGIDDLLIGAPYASGGDGAVFLIFGKSGSSGPGNVNLGSLTTSQGVRFNSPDDGGRFGDGIDASGDVNGDGVNDILISAPGASSNKGKVYVIFGGDLSHFEDLLGN